MTSEQFNQVFKTVIDRDGEMYGRILPGVQRTLKAEWRQHLVSGNLLIPGNYTINNRPATKAELKRLEDVLMNLLAQ